MTPAPRWPLFAASISIACAVAAVAMPTLSRMTYNAADTGDDTFFTLLMTMPVLLIAGLIIAVAARRKAPQPLHPLFRVALWLNAGLLIALVLFAAFGIFSYQGR